MSQEMGGFDGPEIPGTFLFLRRNRFTHLAPLLKTCNTIPALPIIKLMPRYSYNN